MRDLLEAQFSCSIRAWNEPVDDMGSVLFSALIDGELVLADSLALLISALQERAHYPLLLAA